ncbi:uncharacterized protein [Aegilops tauschii subsp. strangulata]|uniref:uncharacterized protein n=1 Tax=Aegilops tauschii subsp. strangulata TaxID=200361 RepID=UPI003CC87D14
MADAPLYKQRRRYTRELHDYDLHGNHKLHAVCTSKGEDVDEMMSTLRRKLGGMPVKLVGVDVEYTHYVKPQRAAVLQLCIEKECLVYHISAAKDRSEYNYQSFSSGSIPMELDKFLMNGEYTFVGFAIAGDKSKLKLSVLEIYSDNYIDIQEDHTLSGFCPLPEKLIKYAAIDAFATYESWRIIYDVIMGLDRAKRDKEAKQKKNKAVIQYSN